MWVTLCMVLLNPTCVTVSLYAQFLPPPVPNLSTEDNDKKIEEREFLIPKGFQPPEIKILTDVLREGVNVFKVNVTSEAPIDDCKIKFKKDDVEKTVDCVKDSGTIFKALVNAKPPNQTVQINARDIYGDSTSTINELSVLPRSNILVDIWESFGALIRSLNIFGSNIPSFEKDVSFFKYWEIQNV